MKFLVVFRSNDISIVSRFELLVLIENIVIL